jgi:hypothetical protein
MDQVAVDCSTGLISNVARLPTQYGETIIARLALSPSTPRARGGATLRALEVDRSARPSEGAIML